MRCECDQCGQPTDNIFEFDTSWKHFVVHTCDNCHEKMQKIDEWQNEKLRTETMICPWCELEFEWEDNIFEEGEGTCNCPYCDKEIEYECEHSIHWTTRKPKELYEEENADE